MSLAIIGIYKTGKLGGKKPSSEVKFIGKTCKDLMTEHVNNPVEAG